MTSERADIRELVVLHVSSHYSLSVTAFTQQPAQNRAVARRPNEETKLGRGMKGRISKTKGLRAGAWFLGWGTETLPVR